jgi:hypothetical protein
MRGAKAAGGRWGSLSWTEAVPAWRVEAGVQPFDQGNNVGKEDNGRRQSDDSTPELTLKQRKCALSDRGLRGQAHETNRRVSADDADAGAGVSSTDSTDSRRFEFRMGFERSSSNRCDLWKSGAVSLRLGLRGPCQTAHVSSASYPGFRHEWCPGRSLPVPAGPGRIAAKTASIYEL